jgi:hypothetical protein
MNATATRKVLNEAFKRFQELPDWPVKLPRDYSRGNDKARVDLRAMLPRPKPTAAPTLSQALAE